MDNLFNRLCNWIFSASFDRLIMVVTVIAVSAVALELILQFM